MFWHGAPGKGETEENESSRRVFMARSTDDGKTFARERAVGGEGGVCACCGLDAFSDRAGNVFSLFRAANQMTNRPITLLVSTDRGEHFKTAEVQNWVVSSCPMSLAALGQGRSGTAAAWETKGNVFFGSVKMDPPSVVQSIQVSEGNGAKHPAIATNSKGEIMVVWTEGTGWKRGGSLAWQVVGGKNEDKGKASGLPPWDYAAAFSRPDGTFVIVY